MNIEHRAITFSIAAHYAPSRVSFLKEVLSAASRWSSSRVDVHVDTNDLGLAAEPEIARVSAALDQRGYGIHFHKVEGLSHPFHLTWVHKERLRDWFSKAAGSDDLFVYTEDDIVLEDHNIEYFASSLGPLKARGLIPGFVRYEHGRHGRVAIDFCGHQIVSPEVTVEIDGISYINPAYPYWAGFIVDRDLCEEYLSSDSFDLKRAENILPNHSCRVHSAMGLCYEGLKDPFTSRYVVPVSKLVPANCCQVWHCAQNYTRTKKNQLGTVKVNRAFLEPGYKAKTRNTLWKLVAAIRSIKHRIIREAAKLGITSNRDYLDRYTTY